MSKTKQARRKRERDRRGGAPVVKVRTGPEAGQRASVFVWVCEDPHCWACR